MNWKDYKGWALVLLVLVLVAYSIGVELLGIGTPPAPWNE